MRRKGIRPPVKWHGGKHYLWSWIAAHFPEHQTYVEPFGGAASVLLNKAPAPVEVYNDLDERLTRLFRVLRDNGEEFRRRLLLTPYSEIEFVRARQSTDDELEHARRDFVRWRQSIGGRGESFSFTLHRIRRHMPDVVSGYLSAIDEELPKIIERLRTVQIVCRPAVEVIAAWDSPRTLVYCDPPYLPETRAAGSRNVYGHEMTEEAHRALCQVLRGCRGKVVLSGYASTLYSELYAGWRSESIQIANHSAAGKKKVVKHESIWMNWD